MPFLILLALMAADAVKPELATCLKLLNLQKVNQRAGKQLVFANVLVSTECGGHTACKAHSCIYLCLCRRLAAWAAALAAAVAAVAALAGWRVIASAVSQQTVTR